MGKTVKLTQEVFISRVQLIHSQYDFSKSLYVNRDTKVTVICPVHKEFEQLAGTLLLGHGCKKCAGDKLRNERMSNKETFVKNARNVHGDKYIYDLVEYKGGHTKVEIICPIHEKTWQTPSQHLNSYGCRQCGDSEAQITKQKKFSNEFVDKVNKVHNNKYDYSLAEYTKGFNDVIVGCPEHGFFTVKASAHIGGTGCKLCNNYGYRSNRPGSFYVLERDSETKIGITNRSLKKRLYEINLYIDKPFRVVESHNFDNGAIASSLENTLIKELRTIYKQPTEKYDGSTECFYDVDHNALLTRIQELIEQQSTEIA